LGQAVYVNKPIVGIDGQIARIGHCFFDLRAIIKHPRTPLPLFLPRPRAAGRLASVDEVVGLEVADDIDHYFARMGDAGPIGAL
jgi:hypothetical protein